MAKARRLDIFMARCSVSRRDLIPARIWALHLSKVAHGCIDLADERLEVRKLHACEFIQCRQLGPSRLLLAQALD
jgi:hypothetical protein